MHALTASHLYAARDKSDGKPRSYAAPSEILDNICLTHTIRSPQTSAYTQQLCRNASTLMLTMVMHTMLTQRTHNAHIAYAYNAHAYR